ncbi:tetratricopeptide repeat-containing sensor histidine kinase [Flavobacterium antarcticum]|uniref:tetratricopeptide repeat-containing sensor histidine kinase n=1 Tax=Flavobacterium antarcticum TaxID=271155 RepID=UPI0003B74EFD|nr:tetratricopeptide repeat-containing sensor histidine kinase [Flavobacterium antarcticum]
MKKLYLGGLLLIANSIAAQQFRSETLDSINNFTKGKNTKEKCIFFLENADLYANTNIDYALLYSKEALKQARAEKDENLLALSYNTMGNVHQTKTQIDSAHYYHTEALKLRKKLKDSVGIADSYNNLGIAFDSQGNFNNALKNYFSALKLYERKKDAEKTAMALVNIGVVYKAQKEYSKAYFYYKKANELYKKIKSDFGIAVTAGNLGAILINFKAYNTSLEYSLQAKEGYEKLKYKRYIAYAISNIALVHDSLHQFSEANKNYLEAIALHEQFDNNFEVANCSNAFSNCLLKQNRYQESIIYADKALKYAQESDANFIAVCALGNLAKAFGKLKNFEQAYYYSNLYNTGMDDLFKSEKTKAVFEIEAKYESEKKSKLLLQIQNKIQRRDTLVYILSLLILSVGLISYLIYRQQKIKNQQKDQEFELKTAISAIESQNNLQKQRISISRDLHDNIGAQLTFIISSINNIKHAFEINNAKLETKLQSISSFTKTTIVELRDTIWAMNAEEISAEDLKLRIFNFIEKAKLATDNIKFEFFIDENINHLHFSSVDGMNIYRVIQEAIHNTIKYANATEIIVDFRKEMDHILIKITDNGIGFSFDDVTLGNGIYNMKKRIKELHGKFELNSDVSLGTTVVVHLPYKKI